MYDVYLPDEENIFYVLKSNIMEYSGFGTKAMQ